MAGTPPEDAWWSRLDRDADRDTSPPGTPPAGEGADEGPDADAGARPEAPGNAGWGAWASPPAGADVLDSDPSASGGARRPGWLRGGRRVGLVAGGVAAALVATGVGVASATGSSRPASSSYPSAAPGYGSYGLRGHDGLGGLFGAVHGQFVAPKSGGGYQTLDIQRGKATAVSSGSLTVHSDDGYTRTYSISSSTVVRAGSGGISSVRTGDQVYVLADDNGGHPKAIRVVDLTRVRADGPPDPRPPNPLPGYGGPPGYGGVPGFGFHHARGSATGAGTGRVT